MFFKSMKKIYMIVLAIYVQYYPKIYKGRKGNAEA